MKKITIAIYQTHPKFGEIKYNVEKVLEKTKNKKFDLLVLPELFSTGYQFKNKKELATLAENIPNDYTTNQMIKFAEQKKSFIIFGIAEKHKNKFYNSACFVGPNGFIGKYRKSHLFYREKEIFTKGNTGFNVFKTKLGKIGIIICFDWAFPEACRTLALKGAQIICSPSNLVTKTCPPAMITRSIENGVFTVIADRIGIEKRIPHQKIIFRGQSQIVDPKGKLVLKLRENKEELKIIQITPNLALDKLFTPKNHLFKDRREDLYI